MEAPKQLLAAASGLSLFYAYFPKGKNIFLFSNTTSPLFRLTKLFLSHIAERTQKVFRQILESSARCNSHFGNTKCLIVHPTANITTVFHGKRLLSLVSIHMIPHLGKNMSNAAQSLCGVARSISKAIFFQTFYKLHIPFPYIIIRYIFPHQINDIAMRNAAFFGFGHHHKGNTLQLGGFYRH